MKTFGCIEIPTKARLVTDEEVAALNRLIESVQYKPENGFLTETPVQKQEAA